MSIMNKIKPLLLERFFDQIKSMYENKIAWINSHLDPTQ
jgi:hypothetical protein